MEIQLSFIKPMRKRVGLSQKALGKLIGVSQSAITKIENGRMMPNFALAMQIFEKLDALENRDGKTAKDVMVHNVITLKKSDTVSKATYLVRHKAISQFPVVDKNGMSIGSIRTNDLIGLNKNDKVGSAMREELPRVSEDTPINIVSDLVKQSGAVIVSSKGKLIGIITAEDLIR